MNKNLASRIAPPRRMDAYGAELLTLQLDDAIRAGVYNIALDMHETEFLSSAGVRVLLAYYQRLKKLGGGLLIASVSEPARAILEISGLAMMAAPAPEQASNLPGKESGGVRMVEHESVEISLEPLCQKPAAACRYIGEPVLSGSPSCESASLCEMQITPSLCGVGLGAFGEQTGECAARLGEWMSVCGTAISLPPDSGVPDYMIASEVLHPKVQLLYAACFESEFTYFGRFSARGGGEVLLADLLAAALGWSETPFIGMALIGETSGLIGASMVKSPLAAAAGEDYFAHPAVRERLALTPEPEHSGEMVMVVGLAAKGVPAGPGRKFLRLAGERQGVWAHLHAAVFSFRAMPSGRVELGALAKELAETEKLRAILHLLNDERPVTGLGQSSFRNGLLWTAPLLDEERGIP